MGNDRNVAETELLFCNEWTERNELNATPREKLVILSISSTKGIFANYLFFF